MVWLKIRHTCAFPKVYVPAHPIGSLWRCDECRVIWRVSKDWYTKRYYWQKANLFVRLWYNFLVPMGERLARMFN
jgi:hypothetical protein